MSAFLILFIIISEETMLHQYKLNGYNIVLDTCSGSVHSVDDVAYDIIAMYETASEDEIVRAMMDKYGNREDVTEEEIRSAIAYAYDQIKPNYDSISYWVC